MQTKITYILSNNRERPRNCSRLKTLETLPNATETGLKGEKVIKILLAQVRKFE